MDARGKALSGKGKRLSVSLSSGDRDALAVQAQKAIVSFPQPHRPFIEAHKKAGADFHIQGAWRLPKGVPRPRYWELPHG